MRLDYLVELGVDAIRLSPIFRSPMADFGYDISDYYPKGRATLGWRFANKGGPQMSSSRIFTVTVVAEVGFVGDLASSTEENVLKHFTDEIKQAASALSLRSVQSVRVLYCGGGMASE